MPGKYLGSAAAAAGAAAGAAAAAGADHSKTTDNCDFQDMNHAIMEQGKFTILVPHVDHIFPSINSLVCSIQGNKLLTVFSLLHIFKKIFLFSY